MCVDCAARRKLARDAWLQARVGEALGHVTKGAAEMVGLTPKAGAKQLAGKQALAKQISKKE